MKVKTYRAATMKQALEEIKKELGQDAFILGGKEVKGKKVMGLFGKNYFEVTAAIDFAVPGTNPAVEGGWSFRELSTNKQLDKIQDTFKFSGSAKGVRLSSNTLKSAPAHDPKSSSIVELAGRGDSQDDTLLLEEIRQLRSMIQGLPQRVSRSSQVVTYRTPRFPHPVYEEVYRDLVARELDQELAIELVDELIKEKKSKSAPHSRAALRKIGGSLARRIHIGPELISTGPGTGQKIVALVGPTGVGKTTTLAKLAARCVLNSQLKVGFVTVDTFRIAATDQLRTYAEIIDVPVRVVEDVRTLARAVEDFADRDVILIDTPGRSPKDAHSLRELSEALGSLPLIQKALLLSATTKRSDIKSIVETYRVLEPDCVIFTKLDETQVYGPMLSHLICNAVPLAYVAVGQNVPKDLSVPDVGRLVSLFQGLEAETPSEKRTSFVPKGSSSAGKKRSPKKQSTLIRHEVNQNV